MVEIKKVDTASKREVQNFVDFPFQLYQGVDAWVPPITADIKTMLDKNKHPFYEHSDAEFFTASENGEMLGRIACIENKKYNTYHNKKQSSFYLFESVDDENVAMKLFNHAFDWSRERGLDYIVGPKGLSSFDGYGFLIEGFEKRQMMTMMNYNKPNYPQFAEKAGFTKIVDWVSSYVNIPNFQMPDKIRLVAEKVKQKGRFKVHQFHSKRDLKKWAWRIGQAYNQSFVNNWEYFPLSDKEIKFVLDNIMVVAVPELIKVITYDDAVVGFLLAFPDISAALQKHKGQLNPLSILSYLRELKRTDSISFNGIGILPEYQGFGGNALLFSEIFETAHSFNYLHGELTQIAESATQMRKDLANLGVHPHKNHRIYGRDL
jgi:GNAT superfamily N-acetyltransferase